MQMQESNTEPAQDPTPEDSGQVMIHYPKCFSMYTYDVSNYIVLELPVQSSIPLPIFQPFPPVPFLSSPFLSCPTLPVIVVVRIT